MESILQELRSQELVVDVVKKIVSTAQSLNPPESYFNWGMAAYELKDFEKAKLFLIDSYQNKESAETAARLAMVFLNIGEYAEAISWVDKAISKDPRGTIHALVLDTEHSYLSIKSKLLYLTGNIYQSKDLLDEALKILPYDILALTLLGKINLHLNNPDIAINYFSMAIEVAPEYLKDDIEKSLHAAHKMKDANQAFIPFILSSTAIMAHEIMR